MGDLCWPNRRQTLVRRRRPQPEVDTAPILRWIPDHVALELRRHQLNDFPAVPEVGGHPNRCFPR
ncbi:hypothetical protein AMC87_CH01596 [Rhizobium phaseoli]|nr:hypothetical protein AMC87_CH01596 [Rhizobium phaseoli]EGE55661.1 hypothetical protein RHECNPAF_890074 [Rhizobium etli CNPAF512]